MADSDADAKVSADSLVVQAVLNPGLGLRNPGLLRLLEEAETETVHWREMAQKAAHELGGGRMM